jgi:hypothetical protein
MEKTMSDYTRTEVNRAVEVSAAANEGDCGWDFIGYGEDVTLTLRGEEVPVEYIARHGGMGEGDDIWVVFRLGTQLFKKSGYYASHYGTDWDGDLNEVNVVERMVTFYE